MCVTVVVAESISDLTFSSWGWFSRGPIDRLACRVCPLNLWQESWPLPVHSDWYNSSLRSRQGGQGGCRAGRPAAGTSRRLQIVKKTEARESHWSWLSVDNFRTLESALVEKIWQKTCVQNLSQKFVYRFFPNRQLAVPKRGCWGPGGIVSFLTFDLEIFKGQNCFLADSSSYSHSPFVPITLQPHSSSRGPGQPIFPAEFDLELRDSSPNSFNYE